MSLVFKPYVEHLLHVYTRLCDCVYTLQIELKVKSGYGDDNYAHTCLSQVAMETTIGNSNPDLWKYVTPNALFEGIRVVIANRLATSGWSWMNYFSDFSMGT